jgi:hypothetical protein
MPARNCRTCARSTPIADGKWECTKHGEAKSVCGDHLYLPPLIGKVVDASDEWVMYDGFVNATESAAEGNAFEGHRVHTSEQMSCMSHISIATDDHYIALRNAVKEEFAA